MSSTKEMTQRKVTRQTFQISVNQVLDKHLLEKMYSKHFKLWNAGIVQLLVHYIYKIAQAAVAPEL